MITIMSLKVSATQSNLLFEAFIVFATTENDAQIVSGSENKKL